MNDSRSSISGTVLVILPLNVESHRLEIMIYQHYDKHYLSLNIMIYITDRVCLPWPRSVSTCAQSAMPRGSNCQKVHFSGQTVSLCVTQIQV